MPKLNYKLYPLGERAVLVEFGQAVDPQILQKVRSLAEYLDNNPFPGLVEYVPAFTSMTVYYDPAVFVQQPGKNPYYNICRLIDRILLKVEINSSEPSRKVEIPVCYGEEFGPDLEIVAEHNGLTPEEVVKIHSNLEYQVYMIGFAPGFPYLGGMSERIAAPRKASPRLTVPAGSVGIAGQQTGVYPIATPGGWQLIGRTPLALFRPQAAVPSLLQAGDRIRFVPVSPAVYNKLAQGAEDNLLLASPEEESI